jgi:hypothetical protein
VVHLDRAGDFAYRNRFGTNVISEVAMKRLPMNMPSGFGVRQSSGAFQARKKF